MNLYISELTNGHIIAQDVFNSYGLHVLASGTIVNSEVLSMLIKHNIDYIEVHEKKEESWKKTIEQNFYHFESSIEKIKTIFERVQHKKKFSEYEISEGFIPFIESIKAEKDIVALLLMLNNKDNYTYLHCVHVGMISYYIAKWINMSEEEAIYIGKAGYLHDIGKSNINNELLNKPSKLNENEYNQIKKHTILGCEIIRSNIGNEDFASTALQHHERLDGSGYPFGLLDSEIHPIAKIVAIADIYSAMITTRVYQKKRDLFSVLKEIHSISFTGLDAQITQRFIENMLPSFLGKKALFSNGQVGIIIRINPFDYFHPLVQIGTDFVDLSNQNFLEIEEIYI